MKPSADVYLARQRRPSRAERRQGATDEALADLISFGDRFPLRDKDLGALASAVARLHALVAAECHARLGGTEAPSRVVYRGSVS